MSGQIVHSRKLWQFRLLSTLHTHTHTAPALTQAHSQDEPTHVQLARRKHVAMCRHVFMLQQAEKSLFACQQGGQPKQNPNQNQKQRRKAGFSRGIHIHVGRSQAPLRLQELVGAFQEVVLASRVPLRHWPGAFHAGVAGIWTFFENFKTNGGLRFRNVSENPFCIGSASKEGNQEYRLVILINAYQYLNRKFTKILFPKHLLACFEYF